MSTVILNKERFSKGWKQLFLKSQMSSNLCNYLKVMPNCKELVKKTMTTPQTPPSITKPTKLVEKRIDRHSNWAPQLLKLVGWERGQGSPASKLLYTCAVPAVTKNTGCPVKRNKIFFIFYLTKFYKNFQDCKQLANWC